MRYLSVCSGMEAASVAWHPLGWTPVGFSEIEPFPCAILKHRFPNTLNYGSLTEYQSWPIEPGAIDLLVGGTPCQSFSVAGLRKGLADPRGNLALTFLGLADKLKPRWIVWENVPGVLSSGGGRDFGSFLGALVELGYGFAYRVLDAQYFGVPQRRRRVFVVGCLGDWRAAAEVLSLREGLRGYLETGNKKRKGPAADAGAGVEAGGLIGGIDYEHNAHGPNDVTGPLLKGSPTGVGHPLPAIAFRKSKRACSTTDNETWVPADASNTLNNFDLGDTRTTHAVVQPSVYENHAQDSRVTGPLEVAPTVAAKFGTGGGNVPLVGSMAVRRLTPVECERLQGFPDNWSRISWKGKAEEECPDGPRYKACGNSMAVPVMRWIGERISTYNSQL
jgi:DNA (cytosine-5)-methyltransferase 1